jgi:hypothetical protein
VHTPAALAELRQASLEGQLSFAAAGTVSRPMCALVRSAGATAAAEVQQPASKKHKTNKAKANLARNPKRMANPLSQQYQEPTAAPAWGQVFSCLKRPLFVDIGCARGRFLQAMALRPLDSEHECNYCGVEIFGPLTVSANAWVDTHGLQNLHFISANINVSLESLSFPNLQLVSLQVSQQQATDSQGAPPSPGRTGSAVVPADNTGCMVV